jgi:hypothetical protein
MKSQGEVADPMHTLNAEIVSLPLRRARNANATASAADIFSWPRSAEAPSITMHRVGHPRLPRLPWV